MAFVAAIDTNAAKAGNGLGQATGVDDRTLGWRLGDISESLEAVVAEERRTISYFLVERGCVVELLQRARGLMSEREVIHLDLEMALDTPHHHDHIEVNDHPPVTTDIPGGFKGDSVTAAIVANCLPTLAWNRMVRLLSKQDMPAISCFRPRPQPREKLG